MLVEADPKSAMAWYAVGCYYQLCGKYDLAQKHFCRATRLNPRSAECWIAFGCSFAARDESDQALASFRAAQRLHSGNHYPMLYMGMEYLRTNHLSLAGHFLKNARLMGPDDPLCYHELGVLAYRKSAWNEATGWFLNAIRIYTERIAYTNSETLYDDDVKAPTTKETFGEVAISLSNLACIEHCQDNFWEPTIFNLGHCYRKMKRFPEALLCFEKCASLCPVRHLFDGLNMCNHIIFSFSLY
jgi:anaphase-promoting complex subunit 6